MMGTGYTVSQGTTPEPFSAEILGVFPDALLPNRDLVIAEVHNEAIDEVGGVWFGMSGSPVFVTGTDGVERLVGAVAFGFSVGPSHIIGLTAAEDMIDVLSYPESRAGRAGTLPRRVELNAAMKRTVARASGTLPAAVPDSLVQMKTPLSVTGWGSFGAKARAAFKRSLARRGLNVRPYAGASVSTGEVGDPAELVPGSNFAATLSFGDLTSAAVGTTTFVCEGRAMAFGHPMFFDGRTTLGANLATAVVVWPDPIFSPFKLATIRGLVGTVDQDRFAGIRARLGTTPTAIPITSRVMAENTGRTDLGRTDVVLSDEVSFLAPFHTYLNLISAMDEESAGSGEITWTVEGRRSNGRPWSLTRSNLASDAFSIPFAMIEEMDRFLFRLLRQSFEKVRITSLDVSRARVRDVRRDTRVTSVQVAVGQKPFRRAGSMTVRPGSRLRVKVKLDPRTGPTETRLLRLRVPRAARGPMFLDVFGGNGPSGAKPAASFPQLLRRLADQPKANHLGAALQVGRKTVDTAGARLPQVVRGGRSILLLVKRANKSARLGE